MRRRKEVKAKEEKKKERKKEELWELTKINNE